MTGNVGRHCSIRSAYIGLVYLALLLVGPFEHHDLLCELKTPQHCTACASSLVGSDPDAPIALDSSHLTDAGKAEPVQLLANGVLLPAPSSGRSPPTLR